MLDGSPFPNLLSEFVYTRTYARWLEDERRRETWPETVRRYVSYIFKDKSVPKGLPEKAEKFILNFDVLGSMRALWCAGPAMDRDNVCGYNCMGEETEFITRQGVRRFSDFKDGDRITVLTHTGAWKPAVVRSYGQQQLFNITLVRGSSKYTVRATRDHQWVLDDGSRTRELRLKDKLVRPPRIVADWDYYSGNPEARNYWAFGYVYGDGTLVKNKDGEYTHSMVRLCGDDKVRFLERFQELGYSTSSPPTFGGDAMAYTGHYLKTLPTIEGDGFENVVAFVRGYLDADGHKNTNGVWPSPFNGIQASKESAIEFIRRVFPAVGAYITQEVDTTGEVTNYGVRPKTSRFGLVLGFGDSENSTFSVKDIQESTVETVWCLEVEDDHSFVLPNGIVTGNCSFLPVDNLRAFSEALYVLMAGTGVGFSVERTFTDNLPVIAPSTGDSIDYLIQDSTEGWADAVYFGMVQYHLGHRVNWNYSLIREKGARLRTKGGRASGPEPLKRVLDFAGETIAGAAGRRLKPIEAHDIMCMIAEIVMVGGFRRASLISFSDVDDAEMRDAKDWSKGTFPSIRYMANNSAVYLDRPSKEVFWREWDSLAKSGSGERGFYIVSPSNVQKRGGEFRSNPCVTGDTRVMTDRGMVQIRDLVGKHTKLLLDQRFGTDGFGHTTEAGAFKTGTKEVYRLTTEEGYTLRLTADHRVMTSRGWVEARHLTSADRIHVTNNGGGFGTKGDENLGMLAGWLAGDGCVLDNGVPRLYFYGEKRELAARMAVAAQAVTGGSLPVVHTYAPADRDTFQSADLREYLGGMTKGRVPEFVWQGTKDCQRSYLSALFSADGSVQGTLEKSASVRLSSVEADLLRDVQMLLLNFGVASKLYLNRQDAGTRLLPDGNGGLAPYPCQADHELMVSKANLVAFHRNVGFMLASKEAKLKSVVDGFVRGPYAEKFVARVASVESCGIEDVYDLTEPTTHSFVANGLVVHNCGEILLRFKRANDPWTGEGGGGQFCNLTAAVMRPHDTLETMAEKVRAATWLGVVQASYTHFPYLRPAWKELCDEDRLIGTDITGQCDNPALSGDEEAMTYLNAVARSTAIIAADALQQNRPAAITCGKPSGNCRPWYALTATDAGLLTLQDLFEHHPNGQEWAPMQRDIHTLRLEGDARKILRTFDNGESPLVRLNLLYGLSVEATPNHKWFVKYRVGPGKKVTEVQDWVPAKDIRTGDVLDVKLGTYTLEAHAKLSAFNSRAWHMAANAKPIRTPLELNEDVCWFLGYLWGDGAMSPGGFRFRFTDENVWNLTKVQRVLMDHFGLEATLSNPKGRKDSTLEFASVHLWHWLLENGVFKYNAEGGVDIIPRVVRSSSCDDIIAFMAGLLDSDGWAGYKRQGLGSFTFTTASPLLARHLQDVAWAVGLGLGRSLNSVGSSFQKKREMYLLGCSSQVNPKSFDTLLRNSNKVQRVADGEWFKDWEWRQAKREYHVGRVLSVEVTSPAPTFDIEVDVDHWYYAGAVKSHNSSQFVDCASGFHTRYAKYYHRHVRISSKDPLFHLVRDQGVPLFKENGQEHLDDDKVDVWVARFPVKSPDGAKLREHEKALEQLERYRQIMRTWCGDKGHNQSATVYVRDEEWQEVGEWLWEHFDEVTGLSFLPYDPTKYRLAPYVEITEEEYHEAQKAMPALDFTVLTQYETRDEGNGSMEPACAGGVCEL